MDRPASQRFPIRLDPRFGWFLRIFGVRPGNAYVDLDDTLDARFGWSRIKAPVSSIERWSIEGPWLALTAMGVYQAENAKIVIGAYSLAPSQPRLIARAKPYV